MKNLLDILEARVAKQVEGWKLPQLPRQTRTWIGDNLWWLVLILAILAAVNAIELFFAGKLVSLPFIVEVTAAVVLGVAVSALKSKELMGWKLLFAGWALVALSIIVDVTVSILSFHLLGAFSQAILGALFLAATAYLLLESKSQFMHVMKSKGAQKKR